MCQSEEGDANVLKNLYMQECEGSIGEAVELEENMCIEVETVR